MRRRRSSRRSGRVDEVRCLAVLAALLSAGTADANQRSAAVVNAFATYCTPGPPDFAAIDARATALKFPVEKDVSAPPQPDQSARSKSWRVALEGGGSFELVAAEAHAPKREAASCGIGAEGVDGQTLKQDLAKALKLAPPLHETTSADGTQHTTMWGYGEDLTLMLVDGATPMAKPGVYLTMLYHRDLSR